MSSKVSFTVRRPTPPSRTDSSGPDSDAAASMRRTLLHHVVGPNDSIPASPLARSAASSPSPTPIYHEHELDSSDEDGQDELLTSFDQIAVQRCVAFFLPNHSCLNSRKPFHTPPTFPSSRNKGKLDSGPLVIPTLQNKDWRAVARKRRSAAQFVPPSAQAQTGQDRSVGGSGTNDTINTGPILAGLQVKRKETFVKIEAVQDVGEETPDVDMVTEETEDQRALRAIFANAEGIETEEYHDVKIIPTPVSEAEALRQDIEELPEVATLEDYDRVPVSQFGAAMLRGMGWNDSSATSQNGKDHVKPYLPQARPALLGIGAKEKEIFDDGSRKKKDNRRPERRYVPVVRKEREGTSGLASDRQDSRQSSRRSSRSPDRKKDRGYDDRRDDHYREDRRDRKYDDDRERERGHRERDRERGNGRARDQLNSVENGRRRDRSCESSKRSRKD
ncbi:hypothetical protein APHAL10511_000156 [Amanita phalloides]|nr:hypothetical protein APHAL10511_000156 [Amanita phalloides]